MGCSSCGTSKDVNGKPLGCNSNGGCASGGCNRLNTFDWLSTMDIYEPEKFDIVEVSFKHGSRKSFFKNEEHTKASTGDMVVVNTGNGYDVGRISLSGELVRLQMKKKRVKENALFTNVIRKANHRDLEKLSEARNKEKATMIKARVIARKLKLEMKIGDVEYQADNRKATFYYTAEGRVDFRELIRHYAKEFRVKIEMRQIGARQESARIGGIGSCGRELCCSTWLTDFKSVSTGAARYQNLAINQSKLSGQCGRLKCCLNYELDTYMDALSHFPKNVDQLYTEAGKATLVKTDIFKGIMYYAYFENPNSRGKFYPLAIERVKMIKAQNEAGEKPTDLVDINALIDSEEEINDYGDVTGVIELPMEKRHKKRRKNRRSRGPGKEQQKNSRKPGTDSKTSSSNRKRTDAKESGESEKGGASRQGGRSKRRGGRNRKNRGSNNKSNTPNKN